MRRALRSRPGRLLRAGLVVLFVLYLVSQSVDRPAARGATPSLLPTQMPARGETRLDSRLMHVVAVLAGRGALVYCWSTADWQRKIDDWRFPQLGPLSAWRAYTSAQPRLTVNLPPNVCTELERLRRSHLPVWQSSAVDALTWSVGSVAHEAVHVSGIADEAKATCYGMQKIAAAAVELGEPRSEGQYLAWRYWLDWYPGTKPPYYSPECRNGGRLDLRPGSDIWP